MRFFKSPKVNMLLPYLLFATAVIIIYQVIINISFVFSALSWIFGVIAPFFYGFVLAYVLNIPCAGLRKLFGKIPSKFLNKRKKGLSIICTYLLLWLFIFFMLNLVIPQIYRSVSFFVANFQTYYDTVQGGIAYISQQLGLDLPGWLSIENLSESLLAFLQDVQFGTALFGTLTNIGMAIFQMVIAFVASIYILIEKEAFKAYLKRMLTVLSSRSICEFVFLFAGELNRNFKQYIFTQTADSLILGAISTIFLYLIGSPFALVLGLILGVLNYIPYLGSIVATIIAILVVLFTQGLTMGIVVAIALLIIQQVDKNIIQPKLMSSSFAVSPLLVIISVAFGGALAGMLGMIVAIPITAVLKDLWDSFLAYQERKKDKT